MASGAEPSCIAWRASSASLAASCLASVAPCVVPVWVWVWVVTCAEVVVVWAMLVVDGAGWAVPPLTGAPAVGHKGGVHVCVCVCVCVSERASVCK